MYINDHGWKCFESEIGAFVDVTYICLPLTHNLQRFPSSISSFHYADGWIQVQRKLLLVYGPTLQNFTTRYDLLFRRSDSPLFDQSPGSAASSSSACLSFVSWKWAALPLRTVRQFVQVGDHRWHMVWSICSFLSTHTFHLKVEWEQVMQTELVNGLNHWPPCYKQIINCEPIVECSRFRIPVPYILSGALPISDLVQLSIGILTSDKDLSSENLHFELLIALLSIDSVLSCSRLNQSSFTLRLLL